MPRRVSAEADKDGDEDEGDDASDSYDPQRVHKPEALLRSKRGSEHYASSIAGVRKAVRNVRSSG